VSNDDSGALAPVEQKRVKFYDDELTAAKAADGQVYVSVRHLGVALGPSAPAQTRRIIRQPILKSGCQGVAILAAPGGKQRSGVLRVDLVPLWLSGVSPKSVRDAVRPKRARFQQEAAKVLWEAFREGRLTGDQAFDALPAADSDAVQAYQIATAVVKLARQQIIMEARLAGRLEDHERRLEQIEATLGDPGMFVTPSQARQISQSVKAVALEIGKKTGRNEHGSVYGQL
jgi:hypothetical protein